MSAQRARPAKERAERILHLFERGEIGGYLKQNEEAVDLSVLLVLKREVERLVRVDARRALRLATVMERLLAHIPDPKARAVASRAKAEALLFLGRFQLALDTYQETVRLYTEGGDVLEGARASIAELQPLAYLSRFADALNVAERAEGVFQRHGERGYLGRLYVNKGNLYFHMDRYREALEYYRRGRRYIGLVSGRDETVVSIEINEAVIHTSLDEMQAAESLLLGAISRAQAMGWTSLAAQAEFNIATVYALDSRYQEALGSLARAGEVFERDDKNLAAIADATRADVYLRLNMSREAVPLAQRAIGRFRAEGLRFDEGLATYTLGIALARDGRIADGIRRLNTARNFFNREGNRVRTAVIDLHLARLEAMRGRNPDARRRGRLAEAAFALSGLPARVAAARLMRAEIEMLAGDANAARRLLRSVPPSRDHLTRFERAFLTGRIAEARGQLSAALMAYGRANALADLVRSSLAGEEHKIAVEGYRAEVADRAVGVLLAETATARIARTAGERAPRTARRLRSRDARVFQFVEGAKARALGDLLDGLHSKVAAPGGGAAETSSGRQQRASRLVVACRRLAWYSAKLEREELTASPAPDVRRRLAREIARLEREVARLRRRDRERARARGSASRKSLAVRGEASLSPSTVPLGEASRILEANEVVVEYFAAGDRLHAFRIERSGARLVSLPLRTRDAERLGAQFAFEIDTMRLAGARLGDHAKGLVTSATARLREMHDLLVAPLGEISPGARLTVVPHGALHSIPFAALEGPRGPLIENATVASAPSVDIFARLRARGASARRIDLVGGAADPNAPEIGSEIDSVALALASRRLVKRASLSSEDFLKLAPRARRIHLATHGRFRRDNPLFSALRFADRWVHLYEILELDLDADLVVLSGCETGSGRRTAGEEMLGIARGFLARGARQLVVSLWPVEDASAGRLAAVFHSEHARGQTAREAIRRASLKIREDCPHPYFWSPFVLLGDDGPTHRREKSK